MVKKPQNVWLLVAGISELSALGWFINTYAPNSWVLISVLFLFLFAISYCFILFFLNNVRRAGLASLGIVLFFLLRFLNLREPFYLILLLASIISLELYLRKQ